MPFGLRRDRELSVFVLGSGFSEDTDSCPSKSERLECLGLRPHCQLTCPGPSGDWCLGRCPAGSEQGAVTSQRPGFEPWLCQLQAL